jgi:DUF4097 and DUF4098 domain-containing protein YvlB
LGSQRFELPVAVTVRVQSRSGSVLVVAEPRDDVEARGERLQGTEEDGGRVLQIRAGRGSGPLEVRCPAGTDVIVGTHSGSVRLEGRLGDVSVTTMSGKIDLDAADDADLRTMSAEIRTGSCSGKCRASTISAKIIGGTAAAVTASTMSGSISFERVEGAFKARSVSGSIAAACGGEGPIAVKTVSGRISISLPDGTAPDACFKTMSGRVDCALPSGHDLRIDAISVSGSIEVQPA